MWSVRQRSEPRRPTFSEELVGPPNLVSRNTTEDWLVPDRFNGVGNQTDNLGSDVGSGDSGLMRSSVQTCQIYIDDASRKLNKVISLSASKI